MKNILKTMMLFIFFSGQAHSEGFRIEARANFMGEAELSLLGTKIASNPDGSGSTNVNGKGGQ